MQTGKMDVLRVVKDVWTLPFYRPGLVAIVIIFGFVLPDMLAAFFLRIFPGPPPDFMINVISVVISLATLSATLFVGRYAVFKLTANAVRHDDLFATTFLVSAWPLFALQFIGGLNEPGMVLSLIGFFFLFLLVPVICIEELSGFQAAKRSAQMVWRNLLSILLCLFSQLIAMLVAFFLMEVLLRFGIPAIIAVGVFGIIVTVVTAMAIVILPVRIYDEIRFLER